MGPPDRIAIIEQVFDTEGMAGAVPIRSLARAEEALRHVTARVGDGVTVRAVDLEPLPVLPELSGLVSGLPRGQAVEVEDSGALAMALTVAASRAGSWCAVVGLPEYGVVAAAELGVAVDQLVLVDRPGERWVDAVAVLLEAVDVVVVRPASRPTPAIVRRLMGIARRSRSCLLVAGPWEGPQVRLRVASALWGGVGDGHGHLRGRRVEVVATGRGAGGRPRSTWLWLPGADGRVSSAGLTVVDESMRADAVVTEATLLDGEVVA